MQPSFDVTVPSHLTNAASKHLPVAYVARLAKTKQRTKLVQYVSPVGSAEGAQKLETQTAAYKAAATGLPSL